VYTQVKNKKNGARVVELASKKVILFNIIIVVFKVIFFLRMTIRLYSHVRLSFGIPPCTSDELEECSNPPARSYQYQL